jgi:hypothetical protein
MQIWISVLNPTLFWSCCLASHEPKLHEMEADIKRTHNEICTTGMRLTAVNIIKTLWALDFWCQWRIEDEEHTVLECDTLHFATGTNRYNPSAQKGAVQWLRPLVPSLSARRHQFNPSPVHVGFIVDKLTIDKRFILDYQLSSAITIPTLPHKHSFIYDRSYIT